MKLFVDIIYVCKIGLDFSTVSKKFKKFGQFSLSTPISTLFFLPHGTMDFVGCDFEDLVFKLVGPSIYKEIIFDHAAKKVIRCVDHPLTFVPFVCFLMSW